MALDNRHQHLIVRAEVRNPPTNRSLLDRLLRRAERRVEKWMVKLIHDIGMQVLMRPKAVYCNQSGNRGLTALVALTTSSSTLHVWDEVSPGILQFDLYTCSDLDIERVFAALREFDPTKIEYKFLDREHGLTLIAESQ